jgi:hypothetical protein
VGFAALSSVSIIHPILSIEGTTEQQQPPPAASPVNQSPDDGRLVSRLNTVRGTIEVGGAGGHRLGNTAIAWRTSSERLGGSDPDAQGPELYLTTQ